MPTKSASRSWRAKKNMALKAYILCTIKTIRKYNKYMGYYFVRTINLHNKPTKEELAKIREIEGPIVRVVGDKLLFDNNCNGGQTIVYYPQGVF